MSAWKGGGRVTRRCEHAGGRREGLWRATRRRERTGGRRHLEGWHRDGPRWDRDGVPRGIEGRHSPW